MVKDLIFAKYLNYKDFILKDFINKNQPESNLIIVVLLNLLIFFLIKIFNLTVKLQLFISIFMEVQKSIPFTHRLDKKNW